MQYSHDLHYTVSACQSQTVFLHFPIFSFYRFLLPVFRALHFFFLYTKEIFLSISPAARLVSASLPDLSILRGHNLLYFSCPFLAYILLCGYSHVFHPQLSTYPQIVDKLWITYWKSCGFSHLTLKIILFYVRIRLDWVYVLLWTGPHLFHSYAHRYTHV